MVNEDMISSRDKLNGIASKVGFLADIFSATDKETLLFSTSGLHGLVVTLSDIKVEIEAVSEAISNEG